jgi:hypothetical protein
VSKYQVKDGEIAIFRCAADLGAIDIGRGGAPDSRNRIAGMAIRRIMLLDQPLDQRRRTIANPNDSSRI